MPRIINGQAKFVFKNFIGLRHFRYDLCSSLLALRRTLYKSLYVFVSSCSLVESLYQEIADIDVGRDTATDSPSCLPAMRDGKEFLK